MAFELANGYAYELVRGNWRTAKDGNWEISFAPEERKEAVVVGQRAIDGMRCVVFALKTGRKTRYWAQTFYGHTLGDGKGVRPWSVVGTVKS